MSMRLPPLSDGPVRFTLDVTYSTGRPLATAPVRHRTAIVMADGQADAQTVATYMTMMRPDCEMVLETRIIDVVA